MKCDLRQFDESTLPDARKVGEEMYSENVFPVLDKILANPLRNECDAQSAGDIAYQDGRPVAFQAAILRRLYLGQRPFMGIVGSTLCSKPETSPVLLMKLMKNTIKPRHGSVLFFANTAIPASAKMNRLLGVCGVSPVSCSNVNFVVYKYGSFLRFAIKRRLPGLVVRGLDAFGSVLSVLNRRRPLTTFVAKVESGIDDSFELFWRNYLENNSGLVASRSKEEVNWMFHAGISNGRVVMISLRDGDAVKGYVAAKSSGKDDVRWMIVDWVAVKNDGNILGDLLFYLSKYLKTKRSAVLLESVGYPMSVQPILKRHLPFRRKLKENTSLYKAFDPEIEKALLVDSPANWFFGGYDGDRCL